MIINLIHRWCHLASVTCLAGISLVGAADEPRNLAINPGFEQWPEKPEEGNVWAAEGYSIGVEGRDGSPDGVAYRTGEGEMDTERRSGDYAQYMQTHTWGRGAMSRGVRVIAGHRYRVSVWAKILTGGLRMNVCFSHAPWTYLGDWVEGGADGDWRQFTKYVDIPDDCQGISVAMFIRGAGYLDDLEIVDMGPVDMIQADTTPLLPGKLADGIPGKRIALFDHPGFPVEGPRDPDWYAGVLEAAGLQVERMDTGALLDARRFSAEKFDTLIFPTGGNLPTDLEETVVGFLAGGGVVLIDGNMTLRWDYQPPAEIRAQMAELRKAYEAGGDAHAYWDFVSKYDSFEHTNLFEYDEEEGRWRHRLAGKQSYEYINFESFFHDLCLIPWPNTGQSNFARPYSEPVYRNEALGEVLAGLPGSIPADPDPTASRGALRLDKAGRRGHGSTLAEEHALDLLLPVYQFADVSHDAYSYSSFRESGQAPEDRDTDFYIVRYNNPLLRGGTLVHLGNLGSRLLASDEGGKILLELLRIADFELPGEPPPEFVDATNEARRLFSEYAGASLAFRDIGGKLARLAFYRGDRGEASALEKKVMEEKSSFEQLAARSQELEAMLFQREDDALPGHAQRLELNAALRAALEKLNEELPKMETRLAAATTAPREGEIQHPLGRIFIGLGNALRHRGDVRAKDLRERIEEMGLVWEGYGVSSYRHEYTFNSHPFKSSFESGTLDPRTGVVEPVKFQWMETDEDRELWIRSFQWQLERAAADQEINLVFGMDERNFGFSLWGPRTRALFLEYLREKYAGDIAGLNVVWGTEHTDFDEIQLPVSKPETQSEHALWEDWTRYREVYRHDIEMMPSVTAVTRYAPELLYLTWSSNYLNERNPASGVNFYEYGKVFSDHHPTFNINGFEHANRSDKEWFTFDIVSMHSRNCTGEWGTFYFPPSGHQEKVDLLTESLWNGIVNGQVGWDLFLFSSAGSSGASFFDMANLPLPLGWQLVLINSDMQKLAPLVLDGERVEPQVRIVYSNTNRRHTAWPDVEGDISYRAVGGLYDFFKRVDIHARAIDEQAVWEGYLPEDCKLLILPEVTYQNQAFADVVLEYLEGGGSVLVTTETGKYDEYGRRRDFWFALAGVNPVAPGDPTIPLGNGTTYSSAAHADRMIGLRPVFPDEVEVLARFQDGLPALTRTRVGQGNLFVLGADLGQDCALQWANNPGVVLKLLQPVLKLAGVEEEPQLNVPRISMRPWEYNGRQFLFLTDPGRMGFQEFEMTLPGDWTVRDYLLGVEVPTEFDGEVTRLAGLTASPGAVVYELAEAQRAPAAARRTNGNGSAVEGDAPEARENEISLGAGSPFEGRIWVDQGKVRAGDFEIQLDVDTGGGWGGEMFMTAADGNEDHRRRLTAGETVVFEFNDKRLKADIREITSVYPGNVECRLEVLEAVAETADCAVRREEFLGRESIFVSNGLIAFRLLPELGGRMIELLTLPDGVNHMAVDDELVRQGGATGGWADFGGMGENAGAWPGPFWNQPFRVTEIEETAELARVGLEMAAPAEWNVAYGDLRGGVNRLVKEFVLRKGESRVDVRLRNYNVGDVTRATGLRTHPKFRVGGDADPGDAWFLVENGAVAERRFPFGGAGAQLRFAAEAGWSAMVDTARRIALVNAFDADAVETVYLNATTNSYNVELWSRVRDIAAGEALELNHSLALVRGLSGVLGYTDGVAANIAMAQDAIAAASRPLEFTLQAGSALAGSFQLKAEVRHQGKTVETFAPHAVETAPGRSASRQLSWNVGTHPGGDYLLVFSVLDSDGADVLQVARHFRVAGGLSDDQRAALAEFQTALQTLRETHAAADDAAATRQARIQITRAQILFEELHTLMDAGETEAAAATENELRSLLGLN